MLNPRKLKVTPCSLELAVQCYHTTNFFPREERDSLTDQMRRAAVSVGSNIAEGCGRGTDREFRASLQHAFASASELEFQVAIARALAFAPAEEVDALERQVVRMKRMLSGLIAAVRERIVKAEKRPKPRRERGLGSDSTA